jgi:hypothetical protein
VCSEAVALNNLEIAARKLARQARWYPYRTSLDELRVPLLQLKMARKAKQTTK